MNTSEPRNSPCPRRCHLCPQSHNRKVVHNGSTYRLGLHCRLYGDRPVDRVRWRRAQNLAYDEATQSPVGGSIHLLMPQQRSPNFPRRLHDEESEW